MFQFTRFASAAVTAADDQGSPGRVAPFGDPGIKASVRLPRAYRSLARPSSPLIAESSTVHPYILDLELFL